MATKFRAPRGLREPRTVIALAALLGLGVLDAQTAARAQGLAPWCLNGAVGWTFDCRYQTLEQCVTVSRGLGGICTQNPRLAPGTEWGRRQRRDGWREW